MKKTFYEVLWELAVQEKMIDKWIYEDKLLNNGTTFSWTPKALEELDVSEVVSALKIARHSDPIKVIANPTPQPEIPITWVTEFIAKFNTKNIGVSGKTTDKVSVVKRLIKFLAEYDYTLDEIAKATDLYIDTLKKQGSIRYIRECGYFISKKIDGVEQSDLAKWCEELKNGSGPAYNSHQIL
jgi:hypothetical protein